MPQVSKQNVKQQVATPKRNGLLGRVQAVNSLKAAPLKLCIFGANRVGKTTLACHSPKRILLVSFDQGGENSIRNMTGVDLIQIVPDNSPTLKRKDRPAWLFTVEELLSLVAEMQQQNPYATVVLDGATSCEDVILANILDLPEVPNQKSWEGLRDDRYIRRSEQAREIIRPVLNLPCNVILLSQEKDHNPPKEERISEKNGKVQPDMRPRFLRGLQQESVFGPFVGGALMQWILNNVPSTVRMSIEKEVEVTKTNLGGTEQEVVMETGKYTRYLRLTYHPIFNPGGLRTTVANVPELVTGKTPQELYQQLIKYIRS